MSYIFLAIENTLPKTSTKENAADKEEQKQPNDWHFLQRVYPNNKINHEVYRNAFKQVKNAPSLTTASAKTQSNNNWEAVGPTNIGGRITSIAASSQNQNVIYVGSATGGVFKTIDGGDTWIPIFDNVGALSIGHIAMHPVNPNIIYVGTGEANGEAGAGAFPGDGLYRSTDGGETWTHLGLAETEQIGGIAINPINPNQIYVAAMGKQYGTNPERGVYRSDDGGFSWEQKLYVTDSTGCIQVHVNPENPAMVYAAMWERRRYKYGRDYGGESAGIYRSSDGGNVWVKLSDGLPESNDNTGRIGLQISPTNPDIIYSVFTTNPITNEFEGIYKSTNGGDSWAAINTAEISDAFYSFGWYFGNLKIHPTNPDELYVLGLELNKTSDSGALWNTVSFNVHADQHAMYIDSNNPDFIILGNDGGIYISEDGGTTFAHNKKLPISQFYACEVDEQFPERIYGGLQDNGTQRTMTGNIDDWEHINGGDGFYVIVDPTDNNYVYAEYQWGSLRRSEDGGNSFSPAVDGINDADRHNWNTPIVLDPSDPSILYTGTQHLYKSTNRAVSWSPISEDLTTGGIPGSVFGTITTIAVAPSNPAVIYVGTDDGNVQRTTDGGTTWELLSANLPTRWITRVAVDPLNADIAYATISGYRDNDYLPHVFMTANGGVNWADISSNLPEVPVNDIVIDPENNSTLYVATDLSVWASPNLGNDWYILGGGLPTCPITDLRLHNPTRKLVAATYGRSIFAYDLTDVNVGINPSTPVKQELSAYPNPTKNPSAVKIQFSLPTAQKGSLQLFNSAGQLVHTIAQQNFAAGKQVFNLGPNTSLVKGTYICRLITQAHIKSVKVVVL